MKVCIIGHPGSGKTYLADKLSDKTGIEKVDVDVLFDKHPFYAISKRFYLNAFNKLMMGKGSWIIDGYHTSLMPDELWQKTDKVIFLNLPKEELKQNVLTRYKTKKENKEFSHWQSTYFNNLKNFGQIKFQDKAMSNDIARIKSLVKNGAIFIELKTRDEIQQFVDGFPDIA